MRHVLFSLSALLLVACGSEVPREVGSDDADIARIAAENNAFTLDMHRALVTADTGNLFHSPFSMNAALSMTYVGARGETADEMADVLHMAAGSPHHGPLGALIRDLDGDKHRAYTVNIANRIWAQEGLAWQQDFLDVNANDYGADVALTDIQANPEATRVDVNRWVADETQNRIQNLLPPGSVSVSSAMVLANAIHFEAAWATPFERINTAPGPFTRLDGSTVSVDTMRKDLYVAYAKGDGYRAAGLAYGTTGDVRLWVLLPDAIDGLPQVEERLTAEGLEGLLNKAVVRKLPVALPKIEFRSENRLSDPLESLGMPLAFTNADFSGMTPEGGLVIDEVFHKAYLRIDEEGTEAAAATGTVLRQISNPRPPDEFFTVDHPYLTAIRDEVSGAILFIGRVVDPSVARVE